jgi:hypothetical protein
MTREKTIGILFAISLVANLALAAGYKSQSSSLASVNATMTQERYNEKDLAFTKLFINDVLKSDGEIALATRLKLDNAIRELKDQELIDLWDTFVNAESERAAQDATKNLLSALVAKINP